MVKYSICIPAYKSKFLRECIHSILDQTVDNLELIILNDCSPEPVEEIVSAFEDSRITYVKNSSNVGSLNLVDNWNKCLSLAHGEYIMIMGDDDRLDPDYLEEFSKLIDNFPGLEVYHCRSRIIDDEGKIVMLTPSAPSYERVYDSIWHRLRQYRSNYISDYVYRTHSLKKREGFYYLPLAWGSDDITAFIASAEKGIAHTNRPVFNYRSNRLSITSTGNDLEKMYADLGYASWLEDFLEASPNEPEDQIVYQHLLAHQKQYMQKRKMYTIAKSMSSEPWNKTLLWLKNRQKLGLSVQEIMVAAAKGINMNSKKA
jgi:glycosyltransferase involved in cell wall biosynthesis